MNKLLNINIGKFPFSIDEDAFHILDDYLEKLNKHFIKSEGNEEIMQDIESRIAELLIKKQTSGKIISKSMVGEVIEILGSPEDFGAAEENGFNDNKRHHEHKTDAKYGIKTGKKLFRDMSDKRVAGVCSGITAYLGIHDPIFVRLFFVILLMAGGSGFLVYCVFWMLAPEAKTSSDRLNMMGEPINIDTIAKKVEEGFQSISNKIDDWQTGKKYK